MTTLGIDTTTAEEVYLTPSQRARGTYVLGATGMGKSRLLERMIVQDLEAGYGVCVLDPHGPLPGALINRVIPQIPPHRLGEVVLLDLTDTAYPFPFNLFAIPDRDDPDGIPRVVSMVIGLYERLWGPDSRVPAWGARMAQTMRNSFYVIASNDGKTLVSLPRLLRDEAYCKSLLVNTRNPKTQAFFQDYWKGTRHHREELSDSTLNKVDEFLSNPIVCNLVGQPDSVPIHDIVDHGLILLVKLDPQLRDVTSLVGGAILSRILHVVLGRGSPRPFALYADEFQRFATKDFATLMTEARKANVWLTVAHQHRGQPGLDDEMLGATLNVATKIFFRLVGHDAQNLVTGIPLPDLFDDTWEQAIEPDYVLVKMDVWDTPENERKHEAMWAQMLELRQSGVSVADIEPLAKRWEALWKTHHRTEQRWVEEGSRTGERVLSRQSGGVKYRRVQKPVPKNEVRGRVAQQLVTLPERRAYVVTDDTARTIATYATEEELGEEQTEPMLRARMRDVVARPRAVVEERVRREWGVSSVRTLPPRTSR